MHRLSCEAVGNAVLGEPVRRVGQELLWRCPRHDDKHPSLSINSRKNVWLCGPCGASGNAWELATFLSGHDPSDKRGIAEWLREHGLAQGREASGEPEAIYPYVDENGDLLFQVLRFPGKKFKQRRPGETGGWIWNLQGVRRVLFRLPEVLRATAVLVVEGERDVLSAERLGFTATTNPHGAGRWKPEYSEFLRGKRVVIVADADEAGRKHAREIARALLGIAEVVKLVELPGTKDLTEWIEHRGTREHLLEILKTAPSLNPAEALRHAKPEPRAGPGGMEPLNAVLDGLVAFIRRFVFLRESQARVVALWVAHTHALQAADTTPYLTVTSAEKRSGKSRLLEVLDVLVANPWMTGRVTAAILMRKVDAKQPTLLLDESDAAFGSGKEYAEALRGMLNSGHRRGGRASCCIGQGANISFRDFSTFCAKAIAGIGKLPDTVGDRTVLIRLKRALPGEVEKFRLREVGGEAARLRRSLEAWCKANMAQLRDIRPELPEQLSDRQQDGAEPLLAIADAAGGAWPQAGRSALVELCGESQAADDSTGVRLLGDVRTIFAERAADRIASAELVGGLAQIETSPWGEWKHGKPLTARGLAHLLWRFGISPRTIRLDPGETAKGYLRGQFEDAWKRYVPPSPRPVSVTASQAAKTLGETHFSHPSQPPL